MKNKLLITTAFAAVLVPDYLHAADINISENKTIVQTGVTTDKNNVITDLGTLNGNITQQEAGDINITGGNIKVNTMSAAISHMGTGDINIEGNAVLEGGNIAGLLVDKETGETHPVMGNTVVHLGDGDINIKGGTIRLDHAGILKVAKCDSGYGDMCEGTPVAGEGDINISGGEILLNASENFSINDINISEGKIHMSNESSLDADKKITISGGTLVSENSEIHANGIEVTGGNITLAGTDFTNDDLSQSFKLTDGTITMNGKYSIVGTNHGDGDNVTHGKFEMSGGAINVNGSENYIEGGDITISGGTVNINERASLQTLKTIISNEIDAVPGEIANIKLQSQGTINLAGQLVSDISGDGNLNIKSSTALVKGDVNGTNLTFETDHSLSKAISGTIGDLASLNVNKGTLTYDKQTGKIGNLNVAGGLDIGTNTVNAGNVDFADNSTLKFTVAGKEDGSHGKIKADTINVSENGTKLDLTLNSSVLGKDETKEFTVLDGNVSGDFAELSQNSRYKFEKVGNGVYEITGTATASDIVVEAGGTTNNAATASAWDSVSLDNPSGSVQGKVANILAELSNKTTSAAGQRAYVNALTALAPEVAPAVQSASTETANQVFGAVGTRLTGGSVSTGSEGMSSGDGSSDAAVWVQGMFNKSKLDDTSKAKGFDADSNGVALGIEKYINKDVKAGIGYAYTNTDIDGFMRSTDVDTHTAIVYGEYKPSNWYVNGIATYGWSDYEENKNVAGVGVKADYDVETFGLQAMTGYDMQFNGLGITPEAGLRYVHIKQDAYKDSADQRVSANDSDILTGVIGAKISKDFELSNGMNIKPEARIAATYDLFNDDVNSVVTLANGSAYAVDGEALDRFGMEFGAGVTAEVNAQVELSLGYEGKFREDYQDHTGLLNAKYKF